MLALRWIAVCVHEQVLRSMVGALKWGSCLDMNQAAAGNIDSGGRLPDVDRQTPFEHHERLLLLTMSVSPALGAWLIAPDVGASMRKPREFAQLRHVSRWLAWFMRTGDPSEF